MRNAGAFALPLLLPGIAAAGPDPVVGLLWQIDHSMEYIHWTLIFEREPDFYTFDPASRQRHSFIIDLWPNGTLSNAMPGEEMRRIYSDWTWGGGSENLFSITTSRQTGTQVLEVIPFRLDGPIVSFNTSFQQLAWDGIAELTGLIYTAHYGAGSFHPDGVISTLGPCVVPAPSALLVAGFGLVFAARRRRG